jgi:hypothetical protein
MTLTSLKARALIGAGIFGAAVAAHFGILYAHAVPLKAEGVLQESLVVFLYLGWVGIGELRRCGKHQLIRKIQAAMIILLAPLLLRHTGSFNVVFMVLSAAVMLFAFVMGLWYRRADNGSQN